MISIILFFSYWILNTFYSFLKLRKTYDLGIGSFLFTLFAVALSVLEVIIILKFATINFFFVFLSLLVTNYLQKTISIFYFGQEIEID